MKIVFAALVALAVGVAPARPEIGTEASTANAGRAGATPTVPGTAFPDLNTPQAAVTPWKLDAVFELPEIPEPSGLCYCELTGTIFAVDDGGPDRQSGLYEIDLEGKHLRGRKFGKDLEGVTYCGANGLLYVCDEHEERVHIVEPKEMELQGSFQVSREFEGKEVLKAGGNGFEGIVWYDFQRLAVGYPQTIAEGQLWLLNQDDPTCIVFVDPTEVVPGETAALRGMVMLPQRNSGELCIDESRCELWVINSWLNTVGILSLEDPWADAVRPHAKVARWEVLPGMAQEGLTFDPQGRMWIGQDVGGVARYVRGE